MIGEAFLEEATLKAESSKDSGALICVCEYCRHG